MTHTHDDHAATLHMHDFEGHVHAAEEDLEYYRAKRLEPRTLRVDVHEEWLERA